MVNNKKQNKRKFFLILEIIFVIVAVTYLFFSFAPKQIYPLTGMVISEPNFALKIENGDEVLISPDRNFENAMTFKEGAKIKLPSGTYYWKVLGKLRESEVRNFTIQDYVSLELKNLNGSYELWNTGNVALNVSKKDLNEYDIIIDIGNSEENISAENNSVYEGRKYE